MAKKKKKTSKKVDRKVRPVTLSVWKTFERVWAENGIVHIQTTTGEISYLTPRTAAQRCRAINAQFGSPTMPADQRARALLFVETVVPIIQEAAYQLKTPSNSKTKLVSNILSNRTAEGAALPVLRDPKSMMADLKFRYPELEEDEIRAVLKEDLSIPEKEGILRTINSDRIMQRIKASRK